MELVFYISTPHCGEIFIWENLRIVYLGMRIQLKHENHYDSYGTEGLDKVSIHENETINVQLLGMPEKGREAPKDQ